MSKTYSLFIGRWQPLHQGHKLLIRKVLDEGKSVLIACRLTGINEKNPFSYEERIKMFEDAFAYEMHSGKMKIIPIENIDAVCYGREVGYDIRKINLDKDIEEISGTKIREEGKLWYIYLQ